MVSLFGIVFHSKYIYLKSSSQHYPSYIRSPLPGVRVIFEGKVKLCSIINFVLALIIYYIDLAYRLLREDLTSQL